MELFRIRTEKNENVLFCLCVVLALFRFSAFGFDYAPLLDDFVQYGVYPRLPDVWNTVLTGGAGTVYTRPLAALADVFFWGRLWGRLWAALLLLCLLYALSGILFFRTAALLELPLSPWFFLFYLFLPLNLEGTYWLSAASRIVTSLFLLSAGENLLAQYLKKGGTLRFVGSAVLCLLSCGFYEQTAAVSCTLYAVILVRERRLRLLWVPLVCGASFAAYSLILGRMGDNAERVSGVSFAGLLPRAAQTGKELWNLLAIHSVRLVQNGIPRGWDTVVRYGLWVWAAVGAALLFLWGSVLWDFDKEKAPLRDARLRLAAGLLLVLAAFAPFLLTGTVWLNFRNLVPALPGAGLMLDALFRLALPGRGARAAVGSAVLALFLLVTVSELADYRTVGRLDWARAEQVARLMEEKGVTEAKVTSSIPIYPEQNAPYRDHIMSLFGSYWGISGAVRAVSGNDALRPQTESSAPENSVPENSAAKISAPEFSGAE